MLFYTILMTVINFIAYIVSIGALINKFKTGNFGMIVAGVVLTGAIILNIVIFFTILLFFKFHIELVLKNQTTL